MLPAVAPSHDSTSRRERERWVDIGTPPGVNGQSKDQRFGLHRDALRRSGCTNVVEEVVRGATAERTALNIALNYTRPDHTVDPENP
jgi:hypothetical protein